MVAYYESHVSQQILPNSFKLQPGRHWISSKPGKNFSRFPRTIFFSPPPTPSISPSRENSGSRSIPKIINPKLVFSPPLPSPRTHRNGKRFGSTRFEYEWHRASVNGGGQKGKPDPERRCYSFSKANKRENKVPVHLRETRSESVYGRSHRKKKKRKMSFWEHVSPRKLH